ncbi:MAG: hypothetical protein KDB03_13710 [Planctomycetales bacterium]|nr:hypothetical protein [Planctomycetales bacterium]
MRRLFWPLTLLWAMMGSAAVFEEDDERKQLARHRNSIKVPENDKSGELQRERLLAQYEARLEIGRQLSDQ